MEEHVLALTLVIVLFFGKVQPFVNQNVIPMTTATMGAPVT